MNRTMIRLALGTTVLSAGLLGLADTAAASTGTAGYWNLAAGASATVKLVCPSYAPVMLTETLKLTPKAGVVVTGTVYAPAADVFGRDYMFISATNTNATTSALGGSATCTAV